MCVGGGGGGGGVDKKGIKNITWSAGFAEDKRVSNFERFCSQNESSGKHSTKLGMLY